MKQRREEFTAHDISKKQKIQEVRKPLTHSLENIRGIIGIEDGYPLESFDDSLRASFEETLRGKFDVIPHGFAMKPDDLPGVDLVEFYKMGDALQALLRYPTKSGARSYAKVDIAQDGRIRTDAFRDALSGLDSTLVYRSVLKMLAALGMNRPAWGGAVALPPSGFNLPTIEGPQVPPGSMGPRDTEEPVEDPTPSSARYEHQLRLSVIAHHEAFIAAIVPGVDTRGGGFSEYFGAVFPRGILLDAGESGNAIYEYRFSEPLSADEVALFKMLYAERWSNRKDAAACAVLDKRMQDILVAHGYGPDQWVRTKREKQSAGEKFSAHPSKADPAAEKAFYAQRLQDYISHEFA